MVRKVERRRATGRVRLPSRRAPRNALFHLPEDITKAAKKGTDDLFETLLLSRSEEERTKFGNLPLKPASKAAYEKHYRHLHAFYSLIGDYQSMLMLLD
jgi:hypothetical protein